MTSDEVLSRSVMYDVQAEMGATFTSFWGWIWSDSFGDFAGEYRSIREGVGVADVSALIKWDFLGPDALRAAQSLCTNDILGLEPGQVRYGALLDEHGKMIDDGTVFRFDGEHCWVMTNRSDLKGHFEQVTEGMAVEIRDITFELPLIQVQGPASRQLLSGLTDFDIARLRYFRFVPHVVEVAGSPVWISRTGFTAELGFELFVAPDHAPELWVGLVEAGATPYGAAVADVQRIESGIVVYELDYAPGVLTPYDVSFDRLVALDRPFFGREALLGIGEHPPHRLKTLRFDGSQPPPRGSEVHVDDVVRGTLTSPTLSPKFGAIAMAVLDTDVAADGTEVSVTTASGERFPAVVDRLPIYDPEGLRARA